MKLDLDELERIGKAACEADWLVPSTIADALDNWQPMIDELRLMRAATTGTIDAAVVEAARKIQTHIPALLGETPPPQLEDFAGLDLTGGIASEDLIRRLRDDS
jgi:hypothetical protein